MSTRTALLLASAALIAAASPVLAQENRYGSQDDHADIEWQSREVVQPLPADEHDHAEHGAGERHEHASGHSNHHGNHHGNHHEGHSEGMMRHQSGQRLAYSQDEREAWLADCRIVMRGEDYYSDRRYAEQDDDNGGLIGGILGAVVGGVAGNRIGGSGDRLAGTLIGAGVGGIAGAVIGSAIDSGDDDYDRRDYRDAGDAYAADYCEAYLRRYEASGSTGQMASAHVQPMMMAAAPARHGGMREVITEEWIDVPAERAEVHTRRRSIPRRAPPQQGKLTPVE